jgi:4-hydroxy-tetrahydrodipicolinate synthase
MDMNFIESNPGPVKCAMAMMGLLQEEYRLPIVPLSDTHREELRIVLGRLNLFA